MFWLRDGGRARERVKRLTLLYCFTASNPAPIPCGSGTSIFSKSFELGRRSRSKRVVAALALRRRRAQILGSGEVSYSRGSMKVSWSLLLFCIATGEYLSLPCIPYPRSLTTHHLPPDRPRRQLELKPKSSSSSSSKLRSAYLKELVYQIPTAQDSIRLQQATTR
jgi:hypothetical protein